MRFFTVFVLALAFLFFRADRTIHSPTGEAGRSIASLRAGSSARPLSSPQVTGFGSTGTVLLPLGSGVATLESIAIQSDGKIVAVGSVQVNGFSQIAIARFNSNGSLDTSFGIPSGKTRKGYLFADPSGIKRDSFGRFVNLSNNLITVFGETSKVSPKCYGAKSPCKQFAIVAVDSSGNLKQAYAWPGNAFGDSFVSAISATDGEKGNFVVVGPSCTQKADPYCTLTGILYNAAGGSWWPLTDDLGVNTIPHAIALEGAFAYGNLAVMITGEVTSGQKKNLFVARYTYNYNFKKFERAQYSSFDLGVESKGVGIVQDLSGKYLVLASVQQNGAKSFALLHIDSHLKTDTLLGSNGFMVSSLSSDFVPSGIGLLTGSKILVTGTLLDAATSTEQFAALGLDNHGQIDPTFGIEGTGMILGGAGLRKNTLSSFAWTRDGLLLAGTSDQYPPPPAPGSAPMPARNPWTIMSVFELAPAHAAPSTWNEFTLIKFRTQ